MFIKNNMVKKGHSRMFDIKVRSFIESLFVGNYKTRMKGDGIEFSDFSEYAFGDDVRRIDWCRSEVSGTPLVRLGQEERDISVYFVCDFEWF